MCFTVQLSRFLTRRLSDSLFTLSHPPKLVKHFFQVFFEAFLMFVRRSQATRLLYHILIGLSTTFFAFFKTFQIVCSEETILRDSSVRITLSNRAVNTFLKFFTKTSISYFYHFAIYFEAKVRENSLISYIFYFSSSNITKFASLQL